MRACFCGIKIIVALLLSPLACTWGAPISMTGANGSYSQTFNTLIASGSTIWTNDATLPGWYAASSKLTTITNTAFCGDSHVGGFYSFGTNNSSDRALGSQGSGSTGNLWWGLALRNDGAEVVTNLDIVFYGEQWRTSGATTQAITFACLSTSNLPALSLPGYRLIPALTFAAPITGGSANALDGNQLANRVRLSAACAVNVPSGYYLVLRWYDPDHDDSDHALAIDDLTLTWHSGTPPFDGVPVPTAGIHEDFATVGLDATGGLPDGWRVDKSNNIRAVGIYSNTLSLTEQLAGNNMSSSSDNGIYNFGAGAAASASDRAVGGLSSSDNSKSINVYVKCRNDTGQTVSRWHVCYNIEKYRQGANPAGFRMQLYAGTNGRDWTHVTPNATVFAADMVTEGYVSAPGPGGISEERIVTLSVPAYGVFYLAWNYSVTSNTTSSYAQALGLDDVEIKPWLKATLLIFR